MKKFLKITFVLVLACVVFGLGTAFVLDRVYRAKAPDVRLLRQYKDSIRKNGTAYCRDGKVLDRFPAVVKEKNGKPVFSPLSTPATIEEIPKIMQFAAMAAEDRRFLSHGGFDYLNVPSLIVRNIKAVLLGGRPHGGSTITMQVIKMAFFNQDAIFPGKIPAGTGSVGRKIFEWVMSRQLEEEFTKDEIMEMYLNLAPFGGREKGTTIKGYKPAVRVWFGDADPRKITTTQAAFLGSLFKDPNKLSETSSKTLGRRNYVLDGLTALEVISTSSAAELKTRPLGISETPGDQETDKTGFLATHVRNQVIEMIGKDDATANGAEVETTFDCELQTIAEPVVRTELTNVESRLGIAENKKRLEVGMAILDPHTGEILAMIGGRSEQAAGLLNRALRRRQVGSTMKPMVYAIAYEHLDLWDSYPPTCLDRKRSYRIAQTNPARNWSPKNYGEKYRQDEISLAQGLIDSSNACTANLAWRLGAVHHPEELEATWTSTMTIHLEPVIEMAERFGYPNTIQLFEPSKIIGAGEATPVEMTAIYDVFPNGGWRHEPHWIKKITVQGVDMTPSLPEPRRVLSSTVAYFMVDNLRRVAAPIQKDIPSEVGGKTGTVNESRVTWFCGFTPTLGGCVFVAHDDNSPMPKKAIGGNTARPIWVAVMKEALKLPRYANPKSFTVPPGIEFQEVNGMKLAVPIGKTVSATVATSTVSRDNEGH